MAAVRFVYFDVGGVGLIDFSHSTKWEAMMSDLGLLPHHHASFSEVFAAHIRDLCIGAIDTETILAKLQDEFPLSLPDDYDMIEDFVARFEKNEAMYALIEDAARRYRVGLLTNMYPGMLGAVNARNLLPKIDWHVVVDSSKIGFQKPEEGIYSYAEQQVDCRPEEILFIDNLEENLQIPGQRGWQTFMFDSRQPSAAVTQLAAVLNNR